MRSKTNRILSLLLVLAMLFSFVPLNVFAEGEDSGSVSSGTVSSGGSNDGDDTSVSYTSVATYDELVAAVAEGKSVKLTSDIVAPDKATFNFVGITVDLGGKTLTLNGESGKFENAALKNGKVVITTYEGDTIADGIFDVYGVSSVDGVTFYSEGCAIYALFDMKDGCDLEIKNSFININNNEVGSGGIIMFNGGNSVTLTDTKVDCTNPGDFINNGTALLDNCDVSLSGTVAGGLDNGINGSALTLKDTVFTVNGATGRGITSDGDDIDVLGESRVTLSDCAEGGIRFKASASVNVADTASVNGTVKVDAAATAAEINGESVAPTSATLPFILVESGVVSVYDEEFVAKIGDVKYKTLAEAFAAVQSGETIELVAGVIAEGTIKLPAALDKVTVKGAANNASVLKDTVISSYDGNSYSYTDITFDGIVFDNSNIVVTGWRSGETALKNWTVNGCTFKNINNTSNIAAVHFNLDAGEALDGFTFTENVIDGVLGGQKSGIYGDMTGVITVKNNLINNVSFRPYVIELVTDDGIADTLAVEGNTFSGSATGRAQALGSNSEGTDTVTLVVSNNIFKGITQAQQICYWNFNTATTTADLSNNYYDIDLLANPSSIYFNNAASNVDELEEIGIFPIYTELNADGTINEESAYSPDTTVYVAEINGTKYESVDEAVAYLMANGGKMTLLAPVTTSLTFNDKDGAIADKKAITIDLNGFTVTSGESTLWVSDGFVVTVTDSKGNGKIVTTSNAGSSSAEAIAVNRDGKVILEGGTVEAPYYGVFLYSGNTIGKEVFVMNGGKVVVPNGGQALSVSTGKATVNDGEVICNKVPGGAGWNTVVYANGVVEINGGEFFGTIGNYGTIAIKGGSFSYPDDPNDGFRNEHLAVGYAASADENGVVTVSYVGGSVTGLSGSGTEEDPYLINNLAELIWFANHVDSCLQDGSSQYKGKFIKLTADIDLAGLNWNPIGEATKDHGSFYGTFDGDGHTIYNLSVNTTVDGAGFFAKVSGGGDGPRATVKNLNFVNVSINSTASYVGGVIGNAGGNSVVENVKVSGNVYVSGYGYVGGIAGHGYPDIYDCSVEATSGSYVKAGYWCAGGIIGYAGEGGTVIDGASVSGVEVFGKLGGAAAVAGLLQNGNSVNNVSAENVNISSNSDYCMGYICGNGEESTVTNVTLNNVTATANGNDITVTDAVASIDGTIYFSLAEAVAAAEGKTVTLLRNVTLDATLNITKAMTLDLNGKTINVGYAEGSTTNHIYAITNNGTLTITGEGVINTRGIFNYGKLVLTSGTINAIDGNGGYGVRNYSGATFVMNGGKIATTLEDDHKVNNGGYDATPVRVDEGASFEMNGGELVNICDFTFAIENRGTAKINGGKVSSVHTTVANYGTLEINDGEFTCNGLEGVTAHVVWASEGTVTINGGSFNGKDNYNGFNVDASAGATVYIKGGKFLNVHSGSLYGEGAIAVSGGIFFDKVSDDRCADGFIPTSYVDENGNTVYGVVEGTFVAEVNGVKYTDLQEAIKAAAPSGTVTLLSDVTVENWIMFSQSLNISDGSIITLDKIDGLTIDGKGYTLTVKKITSAGNGNNLFYDADELNIKNLTIKCVDEAANCGGIGLTSGTIENVTFIGGGVAIYPGAGNVTVNGCTFKNNATAIYFETARDNLVVKGSTFDVADGSYAIILRGGASFTDNTVVSGKVNLANDASSEVSGNDFGDNRFKVYNGATATIESNKINNLVFNEDAPINSTFTENTLSEDAQTALDAVTRVYVAEVNGVKYTDLQKAIEAAGVGETVTIFAGEYNGNLDVNKSITVVGDGTVKFNGQLRITADGATVKNISFNNGSSTAGYINAKDVTVDGCTVVGGNGFRYCYTGGTVTFKNCTVTGSTYGIHFDGNCDGEIIIDNCVITGWTSFASTVDNVSISNTEFAQGYYNQLRFYQNAELTNVKFNPEMTVDFGQENVSADFNGCTVTDGSDILSVIYLPDIAEMGIEVKVDNEAVVVAAMIGDTAYLTIEEAFAAAVDGDTITVFANATVSELVKIEAGVTVDLGGFTVTGSAKKVFEIHTTEEVTFKNGTILNTAAQGRCIDTRVNADLTLNGVTLQATGSGNNQPLTIGGSTHGTTVTITGSKIDAGKGGYGIITFVKSTITIDTTEVFGFGGIYVKAGSDESVITLNSGAKVHTLNSAVDPTYTNIFATIVFECDNVTLSINDGAEVSTKITGDNDNYAIDFNGTEGHKVFVQDGAKIYADASEAQRDDVVALGIAGITAKNTVLREYVEPTDAAEKAKLKAELKNMFGYYLIATDANGNSFAIANSYFEMYGSQLRVHAFGPEDDINDHLIDLRMSYKFYDVEGDGITGIKWTVKRTYKIDGVEQYGDTIVIADNTSTNDYKNAVIINIPHSKHEVEFDFSMSFNVTIDGVAYTVTDSVIYYDSAHSVAQKLHDRYKAMTDEEKAALSASERAAYEYAYAICEACETGENKDNTTTTTPTDGQ